MQIISRTKLLPTALLVLFGCCVASELLAHGAMPPHEGAEIAIITPVAGSVIDSLTIYLEVEPRELQAGALDDLDHIHWGVGPKGSGEAQAAVLTVPDLRLDSYFLGDEATNGEYEVCAYLAREDHSHLSETVCITFILATAGAELLQPQDQAEYTSCDVPFNYNFFANTNIPQNQAARVRYQFNDGVEQVSDLSSSEATIALVNGEHQLFFQAEQINGDPLGLPAELSFSVNSPMTGENICRALRLSRRGMRRSARRPVQRAVRVLTEMRGSCRQHPEIGSLSNRRVRRSIVALRATIRGQRRLNGQVLRLMRRPCRGR